MTELECLEKARRCDAMADESVDLENRRTLRATAQMWRRLGETSIAWPPATPEPPH